MFLRAKRGSHLGRYMHVGRYLGSWTIKDSSQACRNLQLSQHGASSLSSLQDKSFDRGQADPNTSTPARHDLIGEQHCEQRKHGQQKQKQGGFGLPALALFAIGFPLGWYLSDYTPRGTSDGPHGPSDFVKYTLIAKDKVSSTAALFRLKPSSKASVDLDDPRLERAITSVEFRQPQLQIARSYTCLPQDNGQHMDELRFLIRSEHKGEVSNYLHRLPTDAQIDVRGLYPEYILPEDVKSVAFLAGGTGIAPAMQAADILAGRADVHILWSNRRREDCVGGHNDTKPASQGWSFWPSSSSVKRSPSAAELQGVEKGALVCMLERLKKRSVQRDEQISRLSVDYFVDEEGSSIRPEDVKDVLKRLSKHDKSDAPGRQILVVSGPEGFLTYWAGPKQWVDGGEVQGPLRGILSTIDLQGWEVVKL